MQTHLCYIRKEIKCQQTENSNNHYKEGGIKTYVTIISTEIVFILPLKLVIS